MTAPIYHPFGSWCDVCVLPDGRIAWVRVEGLTVVCEIDGVVAWRVGVPSPLLMVRCAFVAPVSSVVAIAKANDVGGSALLIWPGAVKNLGATTDNNAVAITSAAAYMTIAPDRMRIISLLGDGATTERAIPWTSQGIRDVLADGTVIFGDDTTGASINNHNFGEYQKRGNVVVGQSGFGLGVMVDTQFWLARAGGTNSKQWGVHQAQSGPRLAVCAWTELGSYYQEFTPPYPVGAPIPIPPPAPVPVPVPPPTPVPVPEPKVPTPNDLAIAQAVAAQHPELVRLNTSAACGQLVEFIARALNAHDSNWGLLSKSPGEHQYNGHAVDAVIYRATNQVIDLMSGAGDRDSDSGVPVDQQFDIRVKWEETGKRDNNNWMAPIAAGGPDPVPAPLPNPGPAPTPVPVDSSVLQALALIGNKLDQMSVKLDALIAKPIDAPASITFPTYTGTAKLGTTMKFTLEPQK